MPPQSASYAGEALQHLLQASVKIAVSQVAEKLHKHVRTSRLVVNKEVQRNDWIIAAIKGELASKGFRANHSYPQTNFSVFGKSLPDFYFYKEGKHIQAGVVVMMENDDIDEEIDINMPVHLTIGTTEFKMEQNNKHWA